MRCSAPTSAGARGCWPTSTSCMARTARQRGAGADARATCCLALLADRADVPVGALRPSTRRRSTWRSSRRWRQATTKRAVRLMEEHLRHVERKPAPSTAHVPTHDIALALRMTHRLRHAPRPTRATWSATAATRRMRAGPASARIAVQFVLNYEEGGENCVLHGDAGSRAVPLRDVQPAGLSGAPPEHGRRSTSTARAPASGASCASSSSAACRSRCSASAWRCSAIPRSTRAFVELGHEIACHGWRWIHYQDVDEATEREHMRLAMRRSSSSSPASAPARLVHRPRQPEHAAPRRRLRRLRIRQRLLRRRPAVLDAGAQERRRARAAAVVPYTLDTNDMRFALPQGFATGDDFFDYLRDTFDVLYAEGDRARRR